VHQVLRHVALVDQPLALGRVQLLRGREKLLVEGVFVDLAGVDVMI
jgi:hypothetical protein